MNRIARRTAAAEAGFSIVEGLIAALILLIVVLGVLPLISQSMLYNLQGLDATTEANAADDGLDTLLPLDVNAPEIALPFGQTALIAADVYNRYTNDWSTAVVGSDLTVAPLNAVTTGAEGTEFVRTITLQRFDVNDLQTEGDYTFDTPLTGGGTFDNKTAPFRRLRVQIDNERRDATGIGTSFFGYDVTTVKVW